MVELALALPVILLLAFAAVDLARAYAERTSVAAAAEAAARAYAADPSASPGTVARNQDSSTYDSGHCSASPGPTPAASYGEVRVTLTCTFTPITPVLSRIVGTPVIKVVAVARTTY